MLSKNVVVYYWVPNEKRALNSSKSRQIKVITEVQYNSTAKNREVYKTPSEHDGWFNNLERYVFHALEHLKETYIHWRSHTAVNIMYEEPFCMQ